MKARTMPCSPPKYPPARMKRTVSVARRAVVFRAFMAERLSPLLFLLLMKKRAERCGNNPLSGVAAGRTFCGQEKVAGEASTPFLHTCFGGGYQVQNLGANFSV